MPSNRLAVAAAFLLGACIAVLCLVSYPSEQAPTLAEKKALLKQATMQILYGNPNNYYRTRWGDVDITDREVASGNMGKTWNAATDNFAESNAKALAHGWTSGEDTEHGGENTGVGMFGEFGVDRAPSNAMVDPDVYINNPDKYLPAEGEGCPLYPGIDRWILGKPGAGDTCTKTCNDYHMDCESYNAPADIVYMDCIFEAAGEHCSTEQTSTGANDKFKEVTDRPDVLGMGFAPGFCQNHDQCYYFQNGGNSGCGNAPGWNNFRRLCGCKNRASQ